ncbi:TPA: putative holin [Escherichia coli]
MSTSVVQTVGNTPAVSSVVSVGLVALLPGVDMWTLLCACAGALLFVLSAKEIALWERVLYLPVASIGGYAAAAEIRQHFAMVSLPLAAFFGGLLIIGVGIRAVKFVQNGDLSALLRRK